MPCNNVRCLKTASVRVRNQDAPQLRWLLEWVGLHRIRSAVDRDEGNDMRSVISIAAILMLSTAPSHAFLFEYACKAQGKSLNIFIDTDASTFKWRGKTYQIRDQESCAKSGWRVTRQGEAFDFCTATKGYADFEDRGVAVTCNLVPTGGERSSKPPPSSEVVFNRTLCLDGAIDGQKVLDKDRHFACDALKKLEARALEAGYCWNQKVAEYKRCDSK